MQVPATGGDNTNRLFCGLKSYDFKPLFFTSAKNMHIWQQNFFIPFNFTIRIAFPFQVEYNTPILLTNRSIDEIKESNRQSISLPERSLVF